MITKTDSRLVKVQRLESSQLDAIIAIHRQVLGYTLNSRLGSQHLRAVYEHLGRQDGSYLGVAMVDGRPAGVVSGAIDLDSAKSQLLKSFSLGHWLVVLSKIALNPFLLRDWWNGNVIGRPVHVAGKEVRAILTTIAVDPSCQGAGLGRRLVEALEAYFLEHGIRTYRLDTLTENHPAREFYRRLGFKQVDTRADSVVLVKEIA